MYFITYLKLTMKTLTTIFLLCFLIPFNIKSQTFFQKITTGPVVTTLNYSNFSAWGDYDNDGDLDFVVSAFNDNCPGCSYPLMLFKNDGVGNFTRITDNIIAQSSVIGSGLAWGDYDNDGYLDLFACGTINSRNRLFHNEQNGNFTEVTTGEIVNEITSSQSCGWADYNKDGFIDIFLANRYGQSNRLYKNNGNGTFTRILAGSIVNDIGDSRCCAWADYDNDGRPDLFVLNYSGQNDFLYHNNGDGTFTRILTGPVVNDGLWGAGCQWADYDNNGYMDLFVTNCGENPNRLYYNQGDGVFTVNNSLLSQEGNSYGFSWGDYDNDGQIDIFVCNNGENNTLYKNNGGSLFTKVTGEIISQEGITSVASSMTDFNNDGKLDLFVTNRFSNLSNYLYENTGNTGNYITFKLKGCNSNKSGIGARIRIVTGESQAIKEVYSSNGWNSENSIWPHFGLGDVEVIDSVIIQWPSDAVSTFVNVPSNQIVTISECEGIINSTTGTGNVTVQSLSYKLYQNYPNPFNPNTKINFSIPKESFVSIKVYNALGKEVITLMNGQKQEGSYEVEFNGSNLSSGVYFYRIETGEFQDIKQMILIK